jgi:hypothetical protein
MRATLPTVLAVALMLSGGPALAQDARPADRKARVVAAMQRIEQEIRSVKSFNGLRHPPVFTATLNEEIRKFHQDFPEYSDDLERYVAMALPWYRPPAR